MNETLWTTKSKEICNNTPWALLHISLDFFLQLIFHIEQRNSFIIIILTISEHNFYDISCLRMYVSLYCALYTFQYREQNYINIYDYKNDEFIYEK